jgi:hypothetical protein
MIHLKLSITSSRAFNVAIVIPSNQVSDNRLNPANLSKLKNSSDPQHATFAGVN